MSWATIWVNRLWVRILIRSMQFLSRELGPGSFGSDAGSLVSVDVEGFPVGQDAPCDTGELVGQGRGELVSMKPG